MSERSTRSQGKFFSFVEQSKINKPCCNHSFSDSQQGAQYHESSVATRLGNEHRGEAEENDRTPIDNICRNLAQHQGRRQFCNGKGNDWSPSDDVLYMPHSE